MRRTTIIGKFVIVPFLLVLLLVSVSTARVPYAKGKTPNPLDDALRGGSAPPVCVTRR